MLIIKNMLKKHNVNNFYFVKYDDGNKEITSFVIRVEDLEAYDLLNKKLITHLGYIYKKPLTEYVAFKEEAISSLKAKKVAKSFLKKFEIYCEEQENFKSQVKNKF